MKVETIQTSFVGGEFAPALFGRTDIAQYANAAATMENFLIRPYGSVISAPGTEFISECKTGGSTGISRLISFSFSRTDSYIIEMGVEYFRFYTDGGIVVSPGTTPYEVAHTYTADELFEVQYSQINDVIYLSHPDHRTQKLTRVSSTSWTLTDFDFLGGPFLTGNADTSVTITLSSSAGTVNVNVTGSTTLFTVSGSTMGHKNTYWKIGGTVTNSTTGIDEQGYIKLTNVVNGYTATASVIKMTDTVGPTSEWAEGSWSAVRGWPARNTFHQQRLAFARTAEQPQSVWLSQSFIYDNFAVDTGLDDEALDLQLAASEANDIKWIVSAKALVAGTYGGEYAIFSGDNDALTPSNAGARRETSWGSESIRPKKIGNFYYYVQRFGEKLREIFYSWDLDSYKSVDKTILSPHISGDGFKDMAYQQNPDSILWIVTTCGTIACMTREVDQELAGWTRLVTQGNYESIATIPSRDTAHDEVWVIVKRTIDGSTKRYVERFKSQIVPDRQDECFYVHSGLSYSAFDQSGGTLSLSATAGTSVVATCATATFAATDVGQRIRCNSSGTIQGELVITGYTSSTVVVGDVRKDFTTTSYAENLWGLSVQKISNLSHLATSTVIALVDGGTDKPDKVVTGDTIYLSNDGYVVHVGLPYTQKIVTLPQESGSQRGTSQGKIQRISSAAFKVVRSHRGFEVGGSTAELDQIVFRDPSTLMGTPEALYTGTIPNITVRDDYDYGTQLTISNSDPLPIELTSIITSIDTMDK